VRKKYFGGLLAFILLVFCLGFLLVKTLVTAESEVVGFQVRVRPLKLIGFLIESGYYGGEGLWKSVKVTLVSERQPYLGVKSGNNSESFQSASVDKNDKELTIVVHYEDEILEELMSLGESGQERVNRDLLTYICVAQTEKTGLLTWDECSSFARDYVGEDKGRVVFGLERGERKRGFWLVQPVLAGCDGAIECGTPNILCECRRDGTAISGSCVKTGDECGVGFPSGVCSCNTTCAGMVGGYFQGRPVCSADTTQATCGYTGTSYCSGLGYCLMTGSCTWTSCSTTICAASSTPVCTTPCGSTTASCTCTNQCGGTYNYTQTVACRECGPYISSWTPACGSQTRTCTEDCGSNDCSGVSLTHCQHCAASLGSWSTCDANHKRSRTCTENDGLCDGDDCVALGAVGGVITEDCVGTIQGTLFNASDLSSCPADIGTNPAYASIRFSNEVFGLTGTWPVITVPVATDANGNYSESVYAPATYTYDYTNLISSGRVGGVKLECQSAAAAVTTQGEVVRKDTGFWRVYGGWWQVTGGSVYAADGVTSYVPASVVPVSNQKLILADVNGRSGMLSYGVPWVLTSFLGTNPSVVVSDKLWHIESLYQGLRYDYNYYKTRMDVFASTDWDGGVFSYDDKGKGYQILEHTGDVTGGADYSSLPSTQGCCIECGPYGSLTCGSWTQSYNCSTLIALVS
jgi:hypothetical protein